MYMLLQNVIVPHVQQVLFGNWKYISLWQEHISTEAASWLWGPRLYFRKWKANQSNRRIGRALKLSKAQKDRQASQAIQSLHLFLILLSWYPQSKLHCSKWNRSLHVHALVLLCMFQKMPDAEWAQILEPQCQHQWQRHLHCVLLFKFIYFYLFFLSNSFQSEAVLGGHRVAAWVGLL